MGLEGGGSQEVGLERGGSQDVCLEGGGSQDPVEPDLGPSRGLFGIGF